MRSAHSRISLADIISRPVAFDLSSLLKSEKTLFAVVGRSLNCLSVLVNYEYLRDRLSRQVLGQ